MWDILPSGKQIGGATSNFAYISEQLGDQGLVVSRIGNDENGKEILQGLNAFGIDTEYIQIDEKHPTGTVEVILNEGQPSYKITENVAWDFLEFDENLRKLASQIDAVCFGTLAQRNSASRKIVREFLRSTSADALRIFDVNLRQNYFDKEILDESLQLANVFKLNDAELPKVFEICEITGEDQFHQTRNLMKKFELKFVCLTRGASGSLLFTKENLSKFEGFKIEVKDTIGAGDAFTAALTHGLLRNWDLDKINKFANKIGAFVASQSGAMPKFPNNFTIQKL